jgi:hypothetical protein
MSNLVGSTIQITTLPLPVLSTLQASGLVFNTAFATLLLGESFTRFSLLGTILTCGGAALIATFGAIGEPAHNLGQLLALLKERDFIIWMVATLVVAVATILFAHLLKIWSSHQHIARSLPKHERPRSASTASAGSTHPGPRARSFTNQLPPPLKLRLSRLRLIRGLSYALISGILSAHSLLVAKSAVELLVRTIVDHNNQFNRFESWLILLALLFFALTQLYYLHLGLRLCSTSVLYPFVFCIYNIIAILDGLIYFQQGSRLSALHAGLVAVGTVILLLGVLALSWRLDHATPSESIHQAVPPRTPLTPGMGLVQQSTEDELDPLLPTDQRRSSDSSSMALPDEQTPLLVGKSRSRPRANPRPPSSSNTEGIWAELDDEANQDDYLASLPRTSSPFLTHNARKRRRGNSGSSQATADSNKSPNGKKEIQEDNKRRSSAPQASTRTSSDGDLLEYQQSRSRSTSVRFADDQDQKSTQGGIHGRQERASRFDGAALKKDSTFDKEQE